MALGELSRLLVTVFFKHTGHAITNRNGPFLTALSESIDVHDHGLRFFGDPGLKPVAPIAALSSMV